ncbi:MAG: branched-chain amino acid ABC transporter permease [Betaproteobacteria bacterium]|nr:branched-chain amino acid ABC transporter permease [Betaproteobacteria bacterium]
MSEAVQPRPIFQVPAKLGGKRVLLWIITAAAMAVLPLLFKNSFAMSLLSQMGIAVIFALSYNMLLGQTGLLSFGHAVYFGLGAYVCAHALNAVAAKSFAIPVTLLPFIGGFTGLAFGIVFGFVSTKRSGTPFAMISLGIAEMVAACALMFPGFFGGEGGIPTNRVVGEKFLGVSYGPQIQVYYLIAGWCLLCMIAMFALTQTPLGRMANAVRDNPERAKFVGYNPTHVRFLMLCLASFFAGIAGGLATIHYEIVTAENVGVVVSGNVLIMSFVGGVGFFYGPIIGAVLVSFLQSALSTYTQAWLLYFGLFFVVMILFAPGGIASLISKHGPVLKGRLMGRLLPSYALVALAAAVFLAGLVMLVEMMYHMKSSDTAEGFPFLGFVLEPWKPGAWLAGACVFAAGLALIALSTRPVRNAWQKITEQLQSRDIR